MINFCIFALKQEKNIMAKLNRIRIVLAEHDLNNKWLADKLGKDQATIDRKNSIKRNSQMITKDEIQELLRMVIFRR